jgi:hypothetical protein
VARFYAAYESIKNGNVFAYSTKEFSTLPRSHFLKIKINLLSFSTVIIFAILALIVMKVEVPTDDQIIHILRISKS